MEIHLYALCWNDADMLPFFFRHYDPLVSRYFIFDDYSRDGSLDLLHRHPNVEVQPFVRSDPDSFTLSELSVSDECWKRSRGCADWVIVIDIDEHLFHPDLPALLRRYKALGITIVPALGYQMISEEFPRSDELLCETRTQGAPWDIYSKLTFFDPAAITETNYGAGRHGASPTGRVIAPARDELLLLHYKFLGFERTHLRHQWLHSGLRSKDIENGWGYQYGWSEEEFRHTWREFAGNAIDVRTDAAIANCPGPPWWDPFRSLATQPLAQNTALAQSLGEIGALKVLIATTVGERDEALAALAAGREALASSHASLAETERFIGLLQATLAERDGALAEMSKRAEELAAALETVQAELSKRDDALSHAEAALSNQSAAAEALQAENAALRSALAVCREVGRAALAAMRIDLATGPGHRLDDTRLPGCWRPFRG